MSIPEAYTTFKNLKNIIVDKENPAYSDVDGVLYNKDKSILIKYPDGKTQESYEIPESVKIIERMAFSGAENLRYLTVPKSVKHICYAAFFSEDYDSLTIRCRENSVAHAYAIENEVKFEFI